jgi:dTDP-4-dehydrorhamnose reductase
MTVLVFGKTGQVATELQLLPCVVALGREEADLSDPAACAAVIYAQKPKAVINAAAYTAVDRAESDEDLATCINGKAPEAMATACAELGIPFVHISTDYVFRGDGLAPWTPSIRAAPQNAYGRSKLRGEKAVQSIGGRYAILRTSWVFSAHGTNFVKTMLRLSETHSTISVVSDQIGGPTPARAIAKTCYEMAVKLMKDTSVAGTYHLSGLPYVSWAEFAEEVFAQASLRTTVSHIPSSDYPTTAMRPMNSRLDCHLTEQVFNLKCPDWRLSLTQTLRDLEQSA